MPAATRAARLENFNVHSLTLVATQVPRFNLRAAVMSVLYQPPGLNSRGRYSL
jgi:hypothetical protein